MFMSHNPGPLTPTQDILHFILSLAVSVFIFKGQTAFYCYCAYAFQWLPSVHRTQSCQGAWLGSALHQSLVGCQVILQALHRLAFSQHLQPQAPLAPGSGGLLQLSRKLTWPLPQSMVPSSLWALPGLSRPRHLSSSCIQKN